MGPKKKVKRGKELGFDGIEKKKTEERIANWKKNEPDGKWRKWIQMTIKYTYIVRTWSFENELYVDKMICPWGMQEFLAKRMNQKKCYNSFNTLPEYVASHLNITKESFDKEKISIESCVDDGDKGYGKFYVLYCSLYVKNLLPIYLERHKDKLPGSPKMEDFMSHFDELYAVDKSIGDVQDLCGCILPNSPDVKADPNSSRYIKRPITHANKYHFSSVPSSHSTSSSSTVSHPTSPAKRAASEAPNCTSFTKKKKNTLVGVGGELATSQAHSTVSNNKKVNVTVQGKVKLKQLDVGKLLDPKLSIHNPAKDSVEDWAQNFSLSIVLSSANKNISQAATVHIYETAHAGVRGYHDSVLGHVLLDGKKIVPPPKILLNEHNISRLQKALLDGFKSLDNSEFNLSPYKALRGPFSKWYSIFNDGIQKFTKELNGVMIRTLDENYKITNIPWALTKIPGGSMDSKKLCDQILAQIAAIFNKSEASADEEFLRKLEQHDKDTIHPVPPPLFKCCSLESVDFEEKKIQLVFENWPVALVGDGCIVNKKAEQIGLVSPTTRCSTHAASGNMKRMSSSKTMSVPEVVTFAEGLRPILRHFKLSGKSSSLLNDALEILEMKPVKLMVWCPTRMAKLLDCCLRTVNMFPLCDTLVSCAIKKEEVAYFMSPMCFSILHLMADLQGLFIGSFLRKLDTDDALLIEVFAESEKLINALEDFQTPLNDSFLDGLTEDDNGNILLTKVKEGEEGEEQHSITLQISSRPTRTNENKLEKIKRECKDVKQKIVDNLIENIQDQNQKNTIVEFASALDLTRKCDLH